MSSKKRAPAHLVGVGKRQQGKLVLMPRRGPDDALCRRCDDAGVMPIIKGEWRVCECRAGAKVLDQLAAREARG